MATVRRSQPWGWAATLLLVSVVTNVGQAQNKPAEWPQFLGPQRNGIATESGLLKSWPDGGPKEVWRVPGGVGMSGPAISGGKLITLVQRDGKQSVVALDAKTGTQLWQTAIAPAYSNSMGNGPRATPTIVGDAVYTFSGEGILLALQTGDGQVIWQHNVISDFEGKIADYGMASSPLVVGDNVIVTAGVPGAGIVAYDRKTGKVAWKSGSDTAGYSSPALLQAGGRDQIVAFTGKAAVGVDPKSGEPLWRYPFETDFDCNIVTPLAHNGNVFISSGENHGAAFLSLKPMGDTFAVGEVWTSFGPTSSLRNEWQTPVLLDGFLYGFDNVGSAGPVTHLNCVEVATGKRVWQQQRFGKGNLSTADGKLFMSTMKGELVVARASPKTYDELGRMNVVGSTRQAPAIAGGLLYLRDDREIVCIDVREK